MKIISILLLILMSINLSNCKHNKDKSIQENNNLNDDQLYKLAMESYDQGKFSTAKEYFVKISTDFPYSKYAADSQFYEGYSDYNEKDYDLAIIAFDEYINLYPAGSHIEDVIYLKAMCYYSQIVTTNLDQDATKQAKENFESLLQRFPNTEYKHDVNLKLDLILDQLAGKQIEIARYYMLNGNYEAAINRLEIILSKYQTTSYIEEALFRLTESYVKLHLKNEAKKYASILGTNYPSSKWYQKSYNLVK
jgi:outer membrane protein assembly factor BamD